MSPLSDQVNVSDIAQSALASVCTGFRSRNHASLKAFEDSCRHLPGGNTRTVLHSSPFPITFSSASGCYLHSLDGHKYTDFLGEYTAGIYGHNNPTIRAAINAALDSGWSFGGNNRYEKQLAEIVCARFAPTMELVRFCNSGTEANMMAVATALAWTGRKKVMVFEKGYHGTTLSFRTASAGKVHSMTSVNLPHEWVIAPYNDIGKTQEVLEGIEPGSLATILVEPMLGSGGAVPGSKEFLQFLRDYSRENGTVLIFDEVMTSRLGYSGLGYEMGVRPDLMTLGKWVGGGNSFGAFGGRRDMMDMFDPRNGSLAHAGTFNNNVISMAAGVAGCSILDEQQTAKLNALGTEMKEMVQAIIDEKLGVQKDGRNGLLNGADAANGTLETPTDPSVNGNLKGCQPMTNGMTSNLRMPEMWVSGLGSILVIHFAPSSIQSTLQSLFFHHMLAKGIYLAERGFIALCIEITREHVKAFVEATADFVDGHKNLILNAV